MSQLLKVRTPHRTDARKRPGRKRNPIYGEALIEAGILAPARANTCDSTEGEWRLAMLAAIHAVATEYDGPKDVQPHRWQVGQTLYIAIERKIWLIEIKRRWQYAGRNHYAIRFLANGFGINLLTEYQLRALMGRVGALLPPRPQPVAIPLLPAPIIAGLLPATV